MERFVRRDRIGDVFERYRGDDLFRREVGEQFPKWLLFGLGIKVPHRVNNRSRRQMNHPLFRAYPSQLTIARDNPPEFAHVRRQRFEGLPYDQRLERADSRDAQLVAATYGESDAVA